MEPKRLISVIVGLAAMTAATGWSAEEEPLGVSFDGLTLIDHADVDVTYVLLSELFRAADSRSARSSPGFQWASAVTNRSEARSALRIWARTLVGSLNEVRQREPVLSAAPQEKL